MPAGVRASVCAEGGCEGPKKRVLDIEDRPGRSAAGSENGQSGRSDCGYFNEEGEHSHGKERNREEDQVYVLTAVPDKYHPGRIDYTRRDMSRKWSGLFAAPFFLSCSLTIREPYGILPNIKIAR